MQHPVNQSWEIIDQTIESDGGPSERFADGASVDAIQEAAAALDVTFPDDFVDAYRIHNGQQQGVEFLFGVNRLWNLDEIVKNHKALLKSGCYEEDTRNDIGFADNGGNAVILIRLGDGPDYGSVYEMFEDGPTDLADSMTAYLDLVAREFEKGGLMWSAEGGGFETPEDRAENEKYREQHALWDKAAEGPTVGMLKGLRPGTEAEVVGTRFGRVEDGVIHFASFDGRCKLRGSLKGASFNQPIRVRVRVGKRRLFGAPIHDILSWEPFTGKGGK